MTDLVGRVLSGRYRLIAPIGSGASAQVFLADDEGFLRRFRAEAQAAASLNHPNIVAVYDWGEDEGTPYLVTEYLAGGSLRAVLDRGVRLSPSQALLVGLETTRALDYAHRRGFVHRDIKPANLLFGEDQRLRVADFGLARALAEAAWTEPAGAVLGTARYASPESARGEAVDGRADVYSLGLVMIEVVTGRVPFAADTTIATLMARVDTPVEVSTALGPLRRVLVRAGQPTPEDRPDAGEFAVGLMAAAEELARPDPLPLVGATLADGMPVADLDPTMLPGAANGTDTGSGADATLVTTTLTSDEGDSRNGAVGALDDDAVGLEPEETPRRRRRWLRAVLAVLLLAALTVGGLLAWQALAVPSHPVPELVGLDRAAAIDLIEENGWDYEILEGRADGSTPGQILAQDPLPDVELDEGELVRLTVSLGQDLRSVPADLAGLPFDQASARLVEAGFAVGDVQRAFDEAVPVDAVIALAEGTPPEVETGTPIGLVVSDGPQPRTVPAITAGSAPADVCAALAAVQLGCTQVEVFSDTVPAGQVVDANPPPGTQVPRDSAVEVRVSRGPELVVVPDVSTRSVQEAIAVLEGAGLRVDGVVGNPGQTVLITDPLPNSQVPRGTGVILYTRR
jgi:eukaryotic-like serine/threonine-protein kinase